MTRIWTASLSRCVHWELCAFAAGTRRRASLSCGPIGCTGESLSQIHGDELLVRVPHADDGVTAHIDETLRLRQEKQEMGDKISHVVAVDYRKRIRATRRGASSFHLENKVELS